MKRIPDLLSMSRIVLCLPLLIVDAMTIPFWVIYLIAGLTDILDGFLARRWAVESKLGARLDSLADFVFVLTVGYKFFPLLKLPASPSSQPYRKDILFAANNTIRHRIVPFVTYWS